MGFELWEHLEHLAPLWTFALNPVTYVNMFCSLLINVKMIYLSYLDFETVFNKCYINIII
jgi:hypothetical protein